MFLLFEQDENRILMVDKREKYCVFYEVFDWNERVS